MASVLLRLKAAKTVMKLHEMVFTSNHAGGILGGISSSQPIIAHIALKPTSSITVSGKTLNRDGEEVEMITKGRHDPCVGIRAVPIAEAMMAILMDHYLRHRGQCADVTPAMEPLSNRFYCVLCSDNRAAYKVALLMMKVRMKPPKNTSSRL